MTRSYEELSGGVGRAVNYRAERFSSRALFGAAASQLTVDGQRVEFGDFSATGLSYRTDADGTAPKVGRTVEYAVRMGGEPAAHGRGTVVRVETTPEGTHRVGLRFVDRLVRPDSLRAFAADAAFRRSAARGLEAYADVPAPYRAACADAQLFLSHWQAELDARDRALADRPDRAARREETEALALETMRREWRGLRERAGLASDAIGDRHPAWAAARAMTDALFAPFLARSPFLHRCRTKPRGYPGDFVAMSWMYEGRRQGDSTFGRVLDQLGLEEQLARTVPHRRDALLEHLRESVLRARPDDRPLRILDIGAGPARELHEWLDELPPGPRLELVLVDQDEQALAFAHERVAAAALRHGDRVRVSCRHLSFGQLFSAPAELAAVGDCALVYSAGLFDYLRDETAADLTARCFELLEPGGRLLVGNAAAAPVVRWVPEYVLDWKMVYRTPEDMQRLGEPFAGRAKLSLGADASGSWHILSITRPA